MALVLSPSWNGTRFFDNNGNVLAGGSITIYADEEVPFETTTWSTIDGDVPNPNPIPVNADGLTDTEIWIVAGNSYIFELRDLDGNILDEVNVFVEDLGLSLSPSPVWNIDTQFTDRNGNKLAFGTVTTYAAGGYTVKQDTYASEDVGDPNDNPIVLDANGFINTEVWLDPAYYNFVLRDRYDNFVDSISSVTGTGLLVWEGVTLQTAAEHTEFSSASSYTLPVQVTFSGDNRVAVGYIVQSNRSNGPSGGHWTLYKNGWQIQSGDFTELATYAVNYIETLSRLQYFSFALGSSATEDVFELVLEPEYSSSSLTRFRYGLFGYTFGNQSDSATYFEFTQSYDQDNPGTTPIQITSDPGDLIWTFDMIGTNDPATVLYNPPPVLVENNILDESLLKASYASTLEDPSQYLEGTYELDWKNSDEGTGHRWSAWRIRYDPTADTITLQDQTIDTETINLFNGQAQLNVIVMGANDGGTISDFYLDNPNSVFVMSGSANNAANTTTIINGQEALLETQEILLNNGASSAAVASVIQQFDANLATKARLSVVSGTSPAGASSAPTATWRDITPTSSSASNRNTWTIGVNHISGDITETGSWLLELGDSSENVLASSTIDWVLSAPTITTYATLDPAVIGNQLTLSNGNLTVAKTNVQAAYQSVYSTIGKASGKWYWEVNLLAPALANYHNCGVAPAGAFNVNTAFPGSAATGYSYGTPITNGVHYNSSSFVSQDIAWAFASLVPCTLMFALDMDNKRVWFGLNGTWNTGNPATNTSPAFSGLSATTYYPVMGLRRSTGQTQPSLTVNFGATPFNYSVPAGFNPGVYTQV